MTLSEKLERAMNKLAKWRSVLAGQQLGTRPTGDPECEAVRDIQEARLLLRAEVSALTRLLLDKGVCTQDEMQRVMLDEVEYLDRMHEQRFPGMRTRDYGIEIFDLSAAVETLKRWKP